MKKILLLIIVTAGCGFKDVRTKPDDLSQRQTNGSIYDFKMKSLDGQAIDFSIYRGKKLLIVNVASECGYTPQYAGLQQLHQKYGDKITILGFPANNFGGQEPGTNREIATFCKENYGVEFQMFEKISVKGEDMHPLYKWLSGKEFNGWNDKAPGWNFCKYLISDNGEMLKFYASGIKPMSDQILNDILD